MRKTAIIWLLGGFVLLLAAVYFFDIEGEGKRNDRKGREARIFTLKKSDVAAVTLTNSYGAVGYRRENKTWVITEPIVTAGDQEAIESHLEAILNCERDRVVADTTDDLSAYGLARSRFTVRVQSNDSLSLMLLIGDENPTGDFIYAKFAEQARIYTLKKRFLNNIDKSLFDLRDKQIAHFDLDSVRKIEAVSAAGTAIILIRSEDAWRLTQPVAIEAKESEIESFLSRLGNDRAKSFEADSASDWSSYGLDRPQLQIGLFSGKDSLITTFLVGRQASNVDNYYAAESGRPAVFTIDRWTFEGLNKTAFDFQDKQLLRFDPAKVDRIEWQIEDTLYSAVQDNSAEWMFIQPDTIPADGQKIRDWIRQIENLEAMQLETYFPEDERLYGFGKPLLRIFLYPVGETVPALLVANQVDDYYYIKTADRPFIYKIRTGMIDEIRNSRKAFFREPRVE